jgi:sortase (surface protein transpeptidase)
LALVVAVLMAVAPFRGGSAVADGWRAGLPEAGAAVYEPAAANRLDLLDFRELPAVSASNGESSGGVVDAGRSSLESIAVARGADGGGVRQGVASGAANAATQSNGGGDRFDNIAADAPRYISIPAIGLTADVTTLGIKAGTTKEVDAPKELTNAGWFERSAKPSGNGAVFIDGHTPGIFSELTRLKNGDEIVVTTMAGRVYYYQIELVETKKNGEIKMGQVLSPLAGYKRGLNLMTCAGSLVNGAYDSRTIVWAVAK